MVPSIKFYDAFAATEWGSEAAAKSMNLRVFEQKLMMKLNTQI